MTTQNLTKHKSRASFNLSGTSRFYCNTKFVKLCPCHERIRINHLIQTNKQTNNNDLFETDDDTNYCYHLPGFVVWH